MTPLLPLVGIARSNVILMIFWSESGRVELEPKSHWCEKVSKKQPFAGAGILLISGFAFKDFGSPLNQFLWLFWGAAQTQATHVDRGNLDTSWFPDKLHQHLLYKHRTASGKSWIFFGKSWKIMEIYQKMTGGRSCVPGDDHN